MAHDTDAEPVYVTAALLEVLCEHAADADPERVTIALASSPAAALDAGVDLPEETPVLTDFYIPEAGGSVSRVFGMDLAVPPGETAGRFVSHPTGDRAVTKRDDLADRILVAVPPWTADAVAAFDRRGRRYPIVTIDAAPAPGRLQSGE